MDEATSPGRDDGHIFTWLFSSEFDVAEKQFLRGLCLIFFGKCLVLPALP